MTVHIYKQLVLRDCSGRHKAVRIRSIRPRSCEKPANSTQQRRQLKKKEKELESTGVLDQWRSMELNDAVLRTRRALEALAERWPAQGPMTQAGEEQEKKRGPGGLGPSFGALPPPPPTVWLFSFLLVGLGGRF